MKGTSSPSRSLEVMIEFGRSSQMFLSQEFVVVSEDKRDGLTLMLGGHLYVKPLKLYTVPPSPGLPVSRWHCQVFIQVRPKPKSL